MERRDFLRISGMLGAGIAVGGILPSAAQAVRFNRELHKLSETRLAMGTFVSMTLVHASKAEAEEAMGLAFQEIDRLTSLMNRFEESGPVGFLNKEGFIRDMPPHR